MNCKHIETLAKLGYIEEAILTELTTGKPLPAGYIMHPLVEGKDGRLFVSRNAAYIGVNNCPVCGEKVGQS